MKNYKVYTDKTCYYSTSRNSKMHCVKNNAKYCYVTDEKSIVISMSFYDNEKNRYTKLKTKEIENLFKAMCDNRSDENE